MHSTAYDEDVAAVYDILLAAEGKDYLAEALQLVELIDQRRPGSASLFDVACGTGEHLRWLAPYFEVFGAEPSAPMADRARAKVPGVDILDHSMAALSPGRSFDVVTCLFSAVGHLATTAELDDAVARMAKCLNAGGLLLVEPWIFPEKWTARASAIAATVDGMAIARVARCSRDGEWSEVIEQWIVARNDVIDAPVTNVHRMRLFEFADYTGAFERAGLRVEFDEVGLCGRGLLIGTNTRR